MEETREGAAIMVPTSEVGVGDQEGLDIVAPVIEDMLLWQARKSCLEKGPMQYHQRDFLFVYVIYHIMEIWKSFQIQY